MTKKTNAYVVLVGVLAFNYAHAKENPNKELICATLTQAGYELTTSLNELKFKLDRSIETLSVDLFKEGYEIIREIPRMHKITNNYIKTPHCEYLNYKDIEITNPICGELTGDGDLCIIPNKKTELDHTPPQENYTLGYFYNLRERIKTTSMKITESKVTQ